MATHRTDYEAAFQEVLAGLNPAQRAAVDQIEGPVLVLAGPGTGKTHLLAARIGNILLQTDASAGNILCLTFTDAGVRAMRRRLLDLIGPEAHRLSIYTFHSFCNTVIQDHPEYFGRRDLEPVSELERIEFVRRLIDELAVSNPLRQGRTERYYYEPHLLHLFALMKSENWSVEHVTSAINEFLTGLPTHEEYIYKTNSRHGKKGEPKEAKVREITLRMERLRAAVEIFPRYQQLMEEGRRYDFDDMIGWVLRAFRLQPDLLRIYQERYLYLLIDEYQDTNGAQDELSRLLAEYWEKPNIFIVGDDDQSIYEFQGARLQSMVDFYRRHAPYTQLITLTENYRSGQPILDGARQLIELNRLRLVRELSELKLDKELTAAGPHNAPPPRLLEYPNQRAENVAALEQLRDWHKAGTPYGEMAVIYARHQQARELIDLLDRSEIPYRTKRQINVLDSIPVRQLRELLTYLMAERDRPGGGEYLLFRVLHFRCFGISPHDLGRIGTAMHRRYDISWRELLTDPDQWPDKLIDAAAIKRTAAWLEEAIGLVGTLPPARLVERVLNGSGLLHYFARGRDRRQNLQVLGTFLDFVRAETDRRPRLQMAEFIRTLDRMDSNRLSLRLQSGIDADSAVTLVTAHSSKGLEFDRVLLLDCTTAWEPGKRAGRYQFTYPETLSRSGEEDALEARRRLFFVAMTRARRELVLTWSRSRLDGKELSPAQFVDELMSAGLPVTSVSPAADDLEEWDLLRLSEVPPLTPAYEQASLDALVRDFRLSISSLYRYLDCPAGFFYESLLGIPHLQSEEATYGIAIHKALQDYFLKRRTDEVEGLDDLLRFFVREMDRLRGHFTDRVFADRLALGRRNLTAYYRQYHQTWPRQFAVELRVRNSEMDGIPLTGDIDRVDLLGNGEVALLDYKTGTLNSNRLAKATERNPEGGAYWRQLLFYKLLYEGRPGETNQAVRGTISYVTMDASSELPEKTLPYRPAEVEQVRTMIREVYTKILAHEFTGCGKEDCTWCRFLREDALPLPINREVVEALDDYSS